jgi:hypothetical protein
MWTLGGHLYHLVSSGTELSLFVREEAEGRLRDDERRRWARRRCCHHGPVPVPTQPIWDAVLAQALLRARGHRAPLLQVRIVLQSWGTLLPPLNNYIPPPILFRCFPWSVIWFSCFLFSVILFWIVKINWCIIQHLIRGRLLSSDWCTNISVSESLTSCNGFDHCFLFLCCWIASLYFSL